MLQERVNVIVQMNDTQFLACSIVPHSSDSHIHICHFLIRKKIRRAIPGLTKSFMESIGSGLDRIFLDKGLFDQGCMYFLCVWREGNSLWCGAWLVVMLGQLRHSLWAALTPDPVLSLPSCRLQCI